MAMGAAPQDAFDLETLKPWCVNTRSRLWQRECLNAEAAWVAEEIQRGRSSKDEDDKGNVQDLSQSFLNFRLKR